MTSRTAFVALFASAPFSAVLGAIAVALRHSLGSPPVATADGLLAATVFYWFVTWISAMIVGSILIPPIVAVNRLLPSSDAIQGLLAVGVGTAAGAFVHSTILGYGSELSGLYRGALIDGAVLGGVAALGAVAFLGLLGKSKAA